MEQKDQDITSGAGLQLQQKCDETDVSCVENLGAVSQNLCPELRRWEQQVYKAFATCGKNFTTERKPDPGLQFEIGHA